VEAAAEEGCGEGSCGKHEELGLGAVDAGGSLEGLEEVIEEDVADGIGDSFGFVEGVDVADDGFVGFEDTEGVAEDAVVVEGDESGEDAAVDVIEQEIGCAGVVPLEAAVPALGFIAEERAELSGVEVAEIQNFDFLGIDVGGTGLREGGQGRSARSVLKRGALADCSTWNNCVLSEIAYLVSSKWCVLRCV
jgi:hypothetical protein